MDPIRENGHLYMKAPEPIHKTHPWLVASVVVAVLVVASGWLLTVGSAFHDGVDGVKESATGASEIFSQLKEGTADERAEVTEQGEGLKNLFLPYVQAAQTQHEAMDVVTGIVKENLDSTTTTNTETYGEEQPAATETE